MAKDRNRIRWWQLWRWNTDWDDWYFRYKWVRSIYEWAKLETKTWTFCYHGGFRLIIDLEVWVLIPTIVITSREIAITWLCTLFQVEKKG